MFIEPRLQRFLLAPAERNVLALPLIAGTLRSAGARIVGNSGSIDIWLLLEPGLVAALAALSCVIRRISDI